MQRFDLNQIPHSPWKNGGGSTREIVCFPPGAGMDSFAWRISVATISQAGPFSAFAGIDRQIMLL
ncbi:MAG: HutD family protein, partial [Janthinobacterium sp.]